MVNGPNRVYVEQQRPAGAVRRPVPRPGACAEHRPADRRRIGRRIDESSPMVDARLRRRQPRQHRHPAAGARRHLHVDPQVRRDGASTSSHLVSYGSLSAPMARALEIFVALPGSTCIISRRHRLGQDDAAERLSRDHRHRRARRHDRGRGRAAAPAAARGAAGDPPGQHRRQGRGHPARPGAERAADAARPDHHRRVRGAEAFDMLQAMNTGHDGSMTTVHANNTRDALGRIENMVMMGSVDLPLARDAPPDRQRRPHHRPGPAHARRRPPDHAGHRNWPAWKAT